jgi:hypothetical protein
MIEYIASYYGFTNKQIESCIKTTSKKLKLTEKEVVDVVYFNMPRKLKYLSGPYVFIYFKNISGKRILLLGEEHHIGMSCNLLGVKNQNYEVQNWLYDLAKTSTECLDIFVEDFYWKKIQPDLISPVKGKPLYDFNTLMGKGYYTAPLDAVRDKFKNFGSSTTRYHYTDNRFMKNDYEDPLFKWYYKFRPQNLGPGQIKKLKKIEKKYPLEKILNFAIGLNRKYRIFYYDYINELYDLVELDPEYDEDQEKLKFDLIDKQFSKLDPIINKTKFQNCFVKICLTDDDGEMIEDRSEVFIKFIMDIYTLPRIFSKFNEKKMNRGPELCRKDNEIKNVIVYTGGAHSVFYFRFIKEYFNINPEIDIRNEYFQCIKLQKSFNYWK